MYTVSRLFVSGFPLARKKGGENLKCQIPKTTVWELVSQKHQCLIEGEDNSQNNEVLAKKGIHSDVNQMPELKKKISYSIGV